jgi:hypothetical protein
MSFPTRYKISSNRTNDCTWMCGLGRSEAGCRSVAVRVTPLTHRIERGQGQPEQLDQTKKLLHRYHAIVAGPR